MARSDSPRVGAGALVVMRTTYADFRAVGARVGHQEMVSGAEPLHSQPTDAGAHVSGIFSIVSSGVRRGSRARGLRAELASRISEPELAGVASDPTRLVWLASPGCSPARGRAPVRCRPATSCGSHSHPLFLRHDAAWG